MATQQAAPYVDELIYFPFDLPWVSRRVVSRVQPAVFVSIESELWPNVLHELKRRHAMTALANGRVSARSYRRIRLFASPVFRWALGNVDYLLMQTATDAQRVTALVGTAHAATKVAVVGNAKFDQDVHYLTPDDRAALRQRLRIPGAAPVLVAGSTRSREEDAVVMAAYRRLLETHPDLRLVVAPRHVGRAPAIAQMLKDAGIAAVRRTGIDALEGPAQCIILDTVGELADVYAVATVAFVGNSFPPVVKGGGQNLLQPLAHGKPTLFGPKTETVRAEAEMALAAGVGFRVRDAGDLANRCRDLMANPTLLAAIGNRAVELIQSHRGASDRYADAIVRLAEFHASSAGAGSSAPPLDGRLFAQPAHGPGGSI